MSSSNILENRDPKTPEFEGRLRNTFLFVLLPITLIFILIVGGITYWRSRTIIEGQIHEQLDTTLASLSTDINNWVATKQVRLDLAVRQVRFKDSLSKIINTDEPIDEQTLNENQSIILDELQTTTNFGSSLIFNHFFITNQYGKIIIASNSEWVGSNIGNSEFFSALDRETGSYIQFSPEPFYTDQIAVITSAPYYDIEGNFSANVFGISGSLSVQSILADVTRFNSEARSFIITTENHFINLDPYQEVLLNQDPTADQISKLLPIRDSFISGENEFDHEIITMQSFEGDQSIASITWLPSIQTSLAVELSQDIAFGQLNRLAPFSIILTSLLGIVLSIIIILVSRSLADPLAQLTEITGQFSAGIWEKRADVNRNDEIGLLSYTFNQMADDLSGLYQSLETQVLERTSALERRSRQLEATAQVARETAEIHDLAELLTYSTQLISEHFDYYHAGIFLLDVNNRYAVLQAANSEGGQRMLSREHKLEVGQTGVVGYVANTGLPRIALDVGADATFFDNPDLPNTRSEVALPLKIKDNVVGVLDVQSTEPSAFESADVEVLQILADQITVAIENARLIEQSDTTLKELQSVYGERIQLGWRRRLEAKPVVYKFDSVQVSPVDTDSEHVSEITNSTPQINNSDAGHILNVPISLRGIVLGEISLKRNVGNNPWTKDELNLVEDTMNQIAIALDNARLLEETRRRAEHEQTISEISTRLSRSIDIDSILRTAARELGSLPNVADASIYIGTETES